VIDISVANRSGAQVDEAGAVALAQRVMRDTGVIRRGSAEVTEAVEAAEIPAV